LAADLPAHFKGENGILDGEIICLDASGRLQFNDLMFRRGGLFFVIFDALWLTGEGSRNLPLLEQKRRLNRFDIDALHVSVVSTT